MTTQVKTPTRRMVIAALDVDGDDAQDIATKVAEVLREAGLDDALLEAPRVVPSYSALPRTRTIKRGDWLGGWDHENAQPDYILRQVAYIEHQGPGEPANLYFRDGAIATTNDNYSLAKTEDEQSLWDLFEGDYIAYWCAPGSNLHRDIATVPGGCTGEGQWHVDTVTAVTRRGSCEEVVPTFSVEGSNWPLFPVLTPLSANVRAAKDGTLPAPEPRRFDFNLDD